MARSGELSGVDFEFMAGYPCLTSAVPFGYKSKRPLIIPARIASQ